MEDANRRLELNKQDPLANNELGLALAFTGRYKRVIEYFSEAIRLKRQQHIYYFNRGWRTTSTANTIRPLPTLPSA